MNLKIIKNNKAIKFSQFNTSQKKLVFYEIFVYRILVFSLKTFCIDIKTIEHVKKQTVSKKDGRFQGEITRKI